MTFVPPYNPETGVWTVFGDPRPAPSAQVSNQSAVVSMAPTRPEAFTTQAVLTGDIKEASKFIPLARQQMQMMHQTNVNDLEIYNRPVDLGGGRFMNCQRNFTADRAHIHVPGGGKGSLGALHLNFDPSVMDDFGQQTIFDKNNGLPLYMNYFDRSLIDSGGIHVDSDGDTLETGEASGELYHRDSSGDVNGRTFFASLDLVTPFRETSEGLIVGGFGSLGCFSSVFTPSNYAYVNCVSYSSTDGDRTYSVLLVSGSGGESYEREFINSERNKHVLAFRVIGQGIKHLPDGGGVESTQVQEFFLNGQKILETAYEVVTWGSYYHNNMSNYYFRSNCNSGASSSIKQKMLYAAHLNDSQIREVTDNLAAKWGF